MRSSAGVRRLSSSLSERYGLGGHHWKRFDASSYTELIYQALTKNVSWLEVSGQEGGEIAMVGAVQNALERSPELRRQKLTLTTRIGYRSLQEMDNEETSPPPPPPILGDVVATEQGMPGQEKVVHNISSEYVLPTIQSCPLLTDLKDMDNLNLIFLIQNPEVQVLQLLKDDPKASLADRTAYIKQKWHPALESMQELQSTDEYRGKISFGVVSNGLGIPADNDHPMHMNPDLVIDAAKTYDGFSTVLLPANLLEKHGWDTARKIHSEVPSVSIGAIRPLTCYPDLGTGTGYPFRLVDYTLPSLTPTAPGNEANSQKEQYTNDMSGSPTIYQLALQTAMSHFDAEELLEIKQTRDLTMEERETLDGCKLVQSMIHDLDSDLEHIRSFAAHEDELYKRIIPLLYDTFEAIDDQTSDVLQAYFAAYAVAVRYAIAKNTRELLINGEEGNSQGPKYPELPQSMTLQEYSLRLLMAEKAISRIVIGASTMQDFDHQTELISNIGSDDFPLDAIEKAKEGEITVEEKE